MYVLVCGAVTLTICAGFVATAVQFLLTVGAGVGWRTTAHVASGDALLTRSSVKAGVVSTRHGHYLTVLTIEALRTRAGVIILQILDKKERERDTVVNISVFGDHGPHNI